MPERYVPQILPASTASAIVGIPRRRFIRDYIHTGAVAAEQNGRTINVNTASLERAIGRTITCADYCRAEEIRAPERAASAAYARDHGISPW